MNEMIWFIFALVNFAMIVISYKLFGKTGLFAWIAMGTVLANIQVQKTVELFFLTATLGNIMYGTLFLATDTLSEKYGLKDAKRAVYIGFFALVSSVIIMQGAILFVPHAYDEAHGAIEALFGIHYIRVVIGSITAYLISQLLDVHLFQTIKKRFNTDKTLYIRNIGSTLMSQLVDTLIFVPIAFLGVFDFTTVLSIFFTTYVIKLLVAALDTPFIYLMKRIKPLNE